MNPSFTGPAALALLHRYNADSRDGGKAQRMELVNSEDGVWTCTLVGYCSEVCPKGVDPARAINHEQDQQRARLFSALCSAKGSRQMSARKPYVRPMEGWWRRNPYYVRYMIMEVTSVIVAIYAVILLVGVWRLSQGPGGI